MGKYLKFYKKCAETGRMSRTGLCASFESARIPLYALNLFEPADYWSNQLISSHWGGELYEFTPLRQNVVLLLAAMNNEDFNELKR